MFFFLGCNLQQPVELEKNMIYEGEGGNAVAPKFEDYHVEKTLTKIDKETIDFIYKSNKPLFDQFYYKRRGLEKFCKIFAGKYIAIDISQGSETVCTYIFDSSTGEMFESPVYMYSAVYKEDSRLYIKDPFLDEHQIEECKSGIFDCEKKYFLWHEKNHSFEQIINSNI